MNVHDFKQNLLEELYKPYKSLNKCLVGSNGCTQIVFGYGNPDAKIMLIGEAPGHDEDLQGIPFVGRSGKLLTKSLNAIGLSRDEVFITNIVKCRPPNNRKPLPAEILFFKPLLIHEIKIVRPQVICTLGASALEGLLGESFSITKIRGNLLNFENTTLIPTLHPAYVLRNPVAESDLKKDLELAYTISKSAKFKSQ